MLQHLSLLCQGISIYQFSVASVPTYRHCASRLMASHQSPVARLETDLLQRVDTPKFRRRPRNPTMPKEINNFARQIMASADKPSLQPGVFVLSVRSRDRVKMLYCHQKPISALSLPLHACRYPATRQVISADNRVYCKD